MSQPIDRRTFVRNAAGCTAACLAAGSCPETFAAEPAPAAAAPDEGRVAATIHDWLSPFIAREERNLDRTAVIKLLEERGRLCCRRLEFRQKLIADSQGDVDKLVELMGKIVGPQNCTRTGDSIELIYPTDKCGCGWSPKREQPDPNDPYCECSKANNQRLFEIVSGRKVKAVVTESPRRGGKRCRFVIELV
jgi:hypothetical protein